MHGLGEHVVGAEGCDGVAAREEEFEVAGESRRIA